MDNQANEYKVLLSGGQGEIVEKKSRFLATVRKCETEEEAAAFIEEMKKKYWDATHNCSAFVIGARGEITRCSDDGEPSGTAGRPMLETLLAEGMRNVAVVVTRYFGGTLLGTGGLVRAYTQAVKEGLNACETGMMRYGCELKIETDYNGVGKVLYLLERQGIEPFESAYGEEVLLKIRIPIPLKDKMCKDLADATMGRAKVEELRKLYFIDMRNCKAE
ncbi:MAG: YigZ family protein [Lachnoclostridium sp.]|nr:YigZ family protein [Lachnospira sp.]MCM1247684.1 YigZ family protein [Lachnoclostridium sp.]MCM1535072.1 YigZ family protein [Clostridium sp.]